MSELLPGDEAEVSTTPELDDTGADLAPDSPAEGEENTTDEADAAQKAVDNAIGKQHFKYRTEQRRADGLQEQLDEANRKLSTAQGAPGDVVIPPIPDTWDDEFEVKIRTRDDAIKRKATLEQQSLSNADNQRLTEQQAQRLELERSQELNNRFVENATKLGVTDKVLQASQKVVIDYGISAELATALIEDADGPLMVQHLAANPLDLHDLVNANPIQAGIKLGEIKVKAAKLKSKPSTTPDPATVLNGRGAPSKERGPKGATYT